MSEAPEPNTARGGRSKKGRQRGYNRGNSRGNRGALNETPETSNGVQDTARLPGGRHRGSRAPATRRRPDPNDETYDVSTTDIYSLNLDYLIDYLIFTDNLQS